MNDSEIFCNHIIGAMFDKDYKTAVIVVADEFDENTKQSLLPKFFIRNLFVTEFKTCPKCGEKL